MNPAGARAEPGKTTVSVAISVFPAAGGADEGGTDDTAPHAVIAAQAVKAMSIRKLLERPWGSMLVVMTSLRSNFIVLQWGDGGK